MKLNVFACVRQPSQGPTFGIKGELRSKKKKLSERLLRLQAVEMGIFKFYAGDEAVVLLPVYRWCCRWWILSSHSHGRGTALLFKIRNYAACEKKEAYYIELMNLFILV